MDSENKVFCLGVGVVVTVIALVILSFLCVKVIGPGDVGVIYDPFSDGVQEGELHEGLRIVAPWIGVDYYNIKTQEYTMSSAPSEGVVIGDDSITAVTNEGLYVTLDMTILYKILPDKASDMRQEVGTETDYQRIIVRPTIKNVIRAIVSDHSAAEIYGVERKLVESEILNEISNVFASKYLIAEKVQLRDVKLPAELTKSIEEKKKAEQDSLRMEYILTKETQEADRRRIEAQGIADANEIISGSLTNEYLRWYWIENLDEHESVIYVPIGDFGLPLFKDV